MSVMRALPGSSRYSDGTRLAWIPSFIFTMAMSSQPRTKGKKMSTLMKALNGSAVTEKGGLQYMTSGSRCLDFFEMAGSARKAKKGANGMSNDDMRRKMELALAEDRETAIRILLWAYDCRGGAGSRDIMRAALPYFILKEDQDTVLRMLRAIPELGRYDMLTDLLENDDLPVVYTKQVLNIIKDTLIGVVPEGGTEPVPSPMAPLCAKWLPRKGKAANRVRGWLHQTPAEYRHMRSKYVTTEALMSARKWAEIKYEQVPSVCFARSRNAFKTHDLQRFTKFTEKAVKGEVKVNAGVVYPHDVVRDLMQHCSMWSWHHSARPDRTLIQAAEAQWRNLPDLFDGKTTSVFPIIDVSGSMTTQVSGNISAIHVAVALGLYCAEHQRGKFRNEAMCFSGRPVAVELKGDIWERLMTLLNTQDECTTDLGLCIETLVKTAKRNRIPQEDMPDNLLILSDLQFDYTAHDGRGVTATEFIKRQFTDAGYKVPVIIYWNLAARTTNGVPATIDKDGVIMVSGFSQSILKAVLEGAELAQKCQPAYIMMTAVYKDRYDLSKY